MSFFPAEAQELGNLGRHDAYNNDHVVGLFVSIVTLAYAMIRVGQDPWIVYSR